LKGKKKRQFPWYALFEGPSNIQKLAESAGYHAHYEILYRNLSKSTHGTDIYDGTITTDTNGFAQIYQIRLPFEAETVVGFCTSLSATIFLKYYQKRNMKDYDDYVSWYANLKPMMNKINERRIRNKRR
jgi:hypothetical protein